MDRSCYLDVVDVDVAVCSSRLALDLSDLLVLFPLREFWDSDLPNSTNQDRTADQWGDSECGASGCLGLCVARIRGTDCRIIVDSFVSGLRAPNPVRKFWGSLHGSRSSFPRSAFPYFHGRRDLASLLTRQGATGANANCLFARALDAKR